MCLLTLIAIFTMGLVPTWGLLILWLIVDLFLTSTMTDSYNTKSELKAVKDTLVNTATSIQDKQEI